MKQLLRMLERIRLLSDDARSREPEAPTPLTGTACADLAGEWEVSEYDIFSQAFQWYYADFRPRDVDADFHRYLTSGCEEIPFYVSQFIRHRQPARLAA